MEKITITHDAARKGFFTQIEGHEAELTYQIDAEGVLEYNHTYVPDALRGRGIAGKITHHALLWAQEKDKKVRPVCPYVVSYAAKHPEFDSIITA